MMKRVDGALLFLLAVMLMAWPAVAIAADADDIIGLWDTADKDARIEIYKCDAGYCGKIAYLEEPNYTKEDGRGLAGRQKLDRNNPDPALRMRPLVGLEFIRGFRYVGHNRWEGGRIYNPEDGRTYKARISLGGMNRLMFRGYWGISLFGRTEIWVRSATGRDQG